MSKRGFIITWCVLALLMIIGSVYDYQIGAAVFNTSSVFGNIFAAYGELPVGGFFVMISYILFFCHDGQKTWAKVLCILGGLMLFSGAVFFLTMNPTRYLRQYIWPDTPDALVMLIGIVIILAIFYGMAKYTRDMDHKELRRLALVCFLMVLGALLIINVIKIPWGRPRMRLIAVNDLAKFQPWWVISKTQKEALLAAGVASDELKSFPSGHTADSALMLCCSFMALAKKDLKMEKIMFIVGSLYAGIVAFSRMIMGAHFLTDVTVGFAVTLILYMVCRKVFYSKN